MEWNTRELVDWREATRGDVICTGMVPAERRGSRRSAGRDGGRDIPPRGFAGVSSSLDTIA